MAMKSVYIVDDSVFVRGRIIAQLNALKEVIVAGMAEEAGTALADIRRIKPDAVILDIRLRSGSGLDLLKSIKSERPETMVIMLTNYTLPAYKRECMSLGADYFFDKSNDFDKVGYVLNGTEQKH